jgi:outer membrane beta-barrel protein
MTLHLLRSSLAAACGFLAFAAVAQSTPAPRPASEPIVAPQVDRRDVRVPKYPSNDVEVGTYVGSYATENFFVQGVYAQTKVSDEAFRQILPGGVFAGESNKLNYYNLSVGYNILPGEVFLFSSRARPSQFYVIGGVGSTKFVNQRKATYNFGVGFKVFLTDWASLQVDLRDHIYSVDLLGRRENTQNIEFTGGLAFYF